MEARRALDWITHDRPAYWQAEIRRSTEAVARAKDELAQSRTYKRIDEYVPSCAEEKKLLEMAKRRLEYAEEKLETVRKWAGPRSRPSTISKVPFSDWRPYWMATFRGPWRCWIA